MSGIFGLVDLSGAPVSADEVGRMSLAMAPWGRQARRLQTIESAAFGQCVTLDTPESVYESLPSADAVRRDMFTAEARLDNRDELCDSLGVPLSERSITADGTLMRWAYERWGELVHDHLLGDWSFAAWDSRTRQLRVCRDRFGNTSLYWCEISGKVAFASDQRALLTLPWLPKRLNEFYLAQRMVLWPVTDGTATVYQDVHAVPPAHLLVASPTESQLRRHWVVEDVPEIMLPTDRAYAEALLDLLRLSVRSRLRCHGPIGASLSAGLDSTAVVAVAADELRQLHQGLTAFTAVPAYKDRAQDTVWWFHDEWPLASLVARQSGNIEHVRVTAESRGPIAAIREATTVLGEPVLAAASNYYWLLEILAMAQRRGLGAILNGQLGNAAFSWDGAASPTMFGSTRWGSLTRTVARRLVPRPLKRYYRHRRDWWAWRLWDLPWRSYSPINPSFALAMRLRDQMRVAGYDPLSDSASSQVEVLQPRTRASGARAAHWAAASGVDIRDPTADSRLVSFAMAVPARVWQGEMNRWLARQATKGLLPDAIRLNPRRAIQAGDLVARLLAHPHELADAFTEVEASPLARSYVDVPYCRQIAAGLPTRRDPMFAMAVTMVLLRGLSVGLFLAESERAGVN